MEKYCHDLFFISVNLAKLCKSLFDFTEDLCFMFQHLECCWTLRVFCLLLKRGERGHIGTSSKWYFYTACIGSYAWSFRIPFNCVSCSSQVPSWADQKHRSASTTTLTGKRIKPIAVASSPAMVIKIKGDTALLHGRIFLDQLKLWSKAAGWMTSIVMTGEFS